MDEVSAAFAELGDYYPGSKRVRRAVSTQRPVDEEASLRWDKHPYVQKVDGEAREFFFIGALADALHIRPNTARKWLTQGILPKERYRTRGTSVNGSRRLYTRAQIEGLIRIAREEGILDGRNVRATRFPERAKELFRALKETEQ